MYDLNKITRKGVFDRGGHKDSGREHEQALQTRAGDRFRRDDLRRMESQENRERHRLIHGEYSFKFLLSSSFQYVAHVSVGVGGCGWRIHSLVLTPGMRFISQALL